MTDADAGATGTEVAVDDETSPLIVLIDPDRAGQGARGAELREEGARVAEFSDASLLAVALRAAPVDAVVVHAADPLRCQQLVFHSRAQITSSGQCVLLIALQPLGGPTGRSLALMLNLGADTAMDATVPPADLLAQTYALRRLMRNVHMAG